MIIFAIAKVILLLAPILYIFYKDRELWDDPGCSIVGGKDLIYDD